MLVLLASVAAGCFAGDEVTVEPSAETCDTLTVDVAGAGRVTVPEVVGRDAENGYRRLRKADLRIAASGSVYVSAGIGTPRIAAVQPRPGVKIERGSTVRVLLSEGPGALLPPGAFEKSAVPDVRGLTLRSARALLEERSLAWSVKLPALPPSASQELFDAYCVTGQRPDPGTMDGAIVLVVEPVG